MNFDRITITGSVVEYRKILGQGVVVFRVTVGDDPHLSTHIETLTNGYQCSPYSISLDEFKEMVVDASERMRIANQSTLTSLKENLVPIK